MEQQQTMELMLALETNEFVEYVIKENEYACPLWLLEISSNIHKFLINRNSNLKINAKDFDTNFYKSYKFSYQYIKVNEPDVAVMTRHIIHQLSEITTKIVALNSLKLSEIRNDYIIKLELISEI